MDVGIKSFGSLRVYLGSVFFFFFYNETRCQKYFYSKQLACDWKQAIDSIKTYPPSAKDSLSKSLKVGWWCQAASDLKILWCHGPRFGFTISKTGHWSEWGLGRCSTSAFVKSCLHEGFITNLSNQSTYGPHVGLSWFSVPWNLYPWTRHCSAI